MNLKELNTRKKIGDRKLLPIICILAMLLVAVAVVLIASQQNSYVVHAHFEISENDTEIAIIFQEEHYVSEGYAYQRIHTYCGSIEIVRLYDEQIEDMQIMSTNNPPRQRIYGQGRPLNTSIVIVFLARGFVAGNAGMGIWPNPYSGTFLHYADGAAQFILDFHPFNLYRDRMIVYAIKSTTLRVNRNYSCGCGSNPRCNPAINCPSRFFSSYSLGSNGVSDVRGFASQISNNVRFMQVLSNSPDHHYGSANTITINPTGTSNSNVSITSTGVYHGAWTGDAAWTGSWGTVAHEFGHSFGGLRDARCRGTEVRNGFIYSRNVESPNTTRMRFSDFNAGNFSSLRWNAWVGFDIRAARNNPSNIWGATGRRLGGDDRVDANNRVNPSGAYIWVSPNITCIMISTRSSWQALRTRGKCKDDLHFCAICTEEIIRRMQLTINVNLFNTANIGTNEIAITGVNVNARGYFRIPTIINGRQVVELRQSTFANQHNVTSTSLPERLRVIGNSAFSGSSVMNVTLPSTIITIGTGAFAHISSLRTVTFATNSNLQSIGNNAFLGSNISSIVIPNSVTSIGTGAFAHISSLRTVTFAANSRLHSIGTSTFLSSDVRSIIIPASVTTIGDTAFFGNSNLTTITFAASSRINRIGEFAFWGTAINNITLPTSLQSIGQNAFLNTRIWDSAPNGAVYVSNWIVGFRGSISGNYAVREGVIGIADWAMSGTAGITNLTLPDSLHYIGFSAFRNIRISSLTIPESVREIGALAFADNTNLNRVYIKRVAQDWPHDITQLGSEVFRGSSSALVIMVPYCSISIYRQQACPHTRLHMRAMAKTIDITDGVVELQIHSFLYGDTFYIPIYFTNPNLAVSLRKESSSSHGAGMVNVINPTVCFNTSILNVSDWGRESFSPTINNRYMFRFEVANRRSYLFRITVRPSEWTNIYGGFISYDSYPSILSLTGINSPMVELDLEFIYASRGGPAFLGEYILQVEEGVSGYRYFLLHSYATVSLWISFIGGNLNVRIPNRSVSTLLISVYRLYGINYSITWDGTIATYFAGGSGTLYNPYQIANGQQLALLAHRTNTMTNWSSNRHFILTNNIFLNGTSNWGQWGVQRPANTWTPIGNATSSFRGSINGQGFAVRGVFIDNTLSNQGLFGVVSGGHIRNLGIEQSFIRSGTNTGSIVGFMQGGTIVNSYNKGTIWSTGNNVGGLVGQLTGTVANSFNNGNVRGNMDVGGIVGFAASGVIINNFNIGVITGNSWLAGIVGWSTGSRVEFNYSKRTTTINNHLTGIQSGGATGSVNNRIFDANGVLRNNVSPFTTANPITIAGSVRNNLLDALNAVVDNPTVISLPTLPIGTTYYRWTNTASEPIPAFLTSTSGLSFTRINDGTAYSVSRGMASATHIIIPSVHNGLPVTVIDAGGFAGFINMTTITIPDSVTRVGAGAFTNSGIFRQPISDGDPVIYAGNWAVGIREHRWPVDGNPVLREDAVGIADEAFIGGVMSHVNLRNVRHIGNRAFRNTNYLASIYSNTI